MSFNQQDINELNASIEVWEVQNRGEILKRIDQLGIKHSKYSKNRKPLSQSLTVKLRERSGIIERISYSMPRSAVFLHKGVSRSHPKTNPREAKEWFNPVIEKNLDKLAEVVADKQGNMIINSFKIK